MYSAFSERSPSRGLLHRPCDLGAQHPPKVIQFLFQPRCTLGCNELGAARLRWAVSGNMRTGLSSGTQAAPDIVKWPGNCEFLHGTCPGPVLARRPMTIKYYTHFLLQEAAPLMPFGERSCSRKCV